MGSSNPPPQLSLDFKPTFVPKTITQFLGEMMKIGSVSEKILKFDDFIGRLETEMRKIEAFKRELPLCMLLINDAIVLLKEESMTYKKSANEKPVLEEFIPIKKSCEEEAKVEFNRKENDNGDKKNWLSSTQLWNADDHNQHLYQKQSSVNQAVQERSKEKDGKTIVDPFKPCAIYERAFVPFMLTRKEEMPVSGISLTSPEINNPRGGSGLVTEPGGSSQLVPCSAPDVRSNLRVGASQPQPSRKQRRCWSADLHRRFVNALQQLGGSQVATPKQIRELMQVDGLTNDEVKSHLQKYRLHTRRLPSSAPENQSALVLQGGLWMPGQDDYAELSKLGNSHSASPDGPLLNCTTAGTSNTDSMDDGDDEKSENNFGWKGHLYSSGKDSVLVSTNL